MSYQLSIVCAGATTSSVVHFVLISLAGQVAKAVIGCGFLWCFDLLLGYLKRCDWSVMQLTCSDWLRRVLSYCDWLVRFRMAP